jgi:hypothetical protein
MKTLTYASPVVKSHLPQSTTMQTTLYDVIEAIAAEVRADEEALVTAIAVELLRSHKAKFIGKPVRRRACCARANYLSSVSA